MDLVPLACEDGGTGNIRYEIFYLFRGNSTVEKSQFITITLQISEDFTKKDLM